MKMLCNLLLKTILCVLTGSLHAEPVKIVNKNGSEILAEILAVGDETVTIHRSPDGKSFTIKIEDLSESSKKIVSDWKMNQPDPLTKNIELKLKGLKVSLKLPEGKYNYSDGEEKTGVIFNHDIGSLSLTIRKHDLSKIELKERLEKVEVEQKEQVERDLVRANPSQRAKYEPLSYVAKERYGELEGYVCVRYGHCHCAAGEWYLFSRKYEVTVNSFGSTESLQPNAPADKASPFTRKNVQAIIKSLVIENE
jgi:hypothetical protein